MFYIQYSLYRKYNDNGAELPAITIISGCVAKNLLSIIPLCILFLFNACRI